ncbi:MULTISPECIES: hypothetical protein [Pseudomonas syringae group]|uniref:Cobyrinic acid a,c-diamide synthase n=2 Tax=Pseudomonas syringae group TaxID=136849 RepID=A0A3M5U0Y3_9PSED|nr:MULTISPECIES: hypothetical protein [Pseudomonas syringae group]AYL80008.1 hypothetical protein CN228_08600 [Pseudomonas syringae pv. actinidiae str. Shaanxi_M228]KPW51130.1 hypothetical protein ALO86_200198 [Pseudomonas syringae pv. berberidis]OSR65665.1 hypothetical protein BV327_05294 [Pseudomonas syringae pv. actinidiae]OSS28429.1 hypothetical protein BV337_03661 [Pseudomonas syringae pv. actinidiae]QHE95827.1 hypothetical protein PMA4326_003810 [Pseudomonas syringae pv. maculicola str. 
MSNMPASIRGAKKSLQALADFAISQGWAVHRTHGGHVKFTKGGCAPIFTSFTPSDHRAGLNARAQLRRAHPLSHDGERHVE